MKEKKIKRDGTRKKLKNRERDLGKCRYRRQLENAKRCGTVSRERKMDSKRDDLYIENQNLKSQGIKRGKNENIEMAS